MTRTRIAVGVAVAILLGIVVGVIFSAGGPKAPGKPEVAATRAPDSGLQVVVGPPGKTVAPKLPPTVVALPPPTPPASVVQAATVPTPTAASPPTSAQIGAAPARVSPRVRSAASVVGENQDDADAEAEPAAALRQAPPLRPAPPLPAPEADEDEPDEGPQPPVPPPGG